VLLLALIRCERDPQFASFTLQPVGPVHAKYRLATSPPASKLRLIISIVDVRVYSRVDESERVIRDAAILSLSTLLFGAGVGGFCGWVMAGGPRKV
jgi:hypothetical protein